MKEIVRAKCPSCQNVLSIPAEWAERTVKCKHCGHMMQARKKTAAPPPPPVTATPAPAPVPAPMPMPKPMVAPLPVPPAAAKATPAVMPSPAWEPLPEYTPPVATAPLPQAVPRAVGPAPVAAAPVSSSYVSAFDTRDRYEGRGKRYGGPKNSGWIKYAVLAFLFLGLAGGAGALYHFKPELFNGQSNEPTKEVAQENKAGVPKNGSNSTDNTQATTGIFPRRMLAISMHNYLYANPLHNGESSFALSEENSGNDFLIRRLAEKWYVPNDQIFHLTDLNVGKKQPKKKNDKDAPEVKVQRNVPLRMVMEGAITSFTETSREQDRIIILYSGHAFEKDGKAYLIPLEGDMDEPESLIPLEWFYEKVAACKAQEKLVIFDVCRFHPDRGIERPHPGVMSEALEKALHESPEGVSVLTSCSKGEYSYEADYLQAKALKSQFYGGYFLNMIKAAGFNGMLAPENKLAYPADQLPIERLAAYVTEKLPELTKDQFKDKQQTPKLTLKRKETPLPYNPNEALASKVVYPVPPPTADPKQIASILKEIELPSVKSFRADSGSTKLSDLLPFKQETLKEYAQGELKPGDTPNDFQKVVLTAVDEMRKLREAGNGNELPESFVGESSDAAKNALKRVQEVPAKVEVILQEQLDELLNIEPMKKDQPKRWQANFDYVLAQVKFRICYANQYNMSLANVRGGKVPDLTGDQNGYRLTAEITLDKNTAKNYKVMFDEAKKTMSELIKEHPQTPWALLAKADRTVAIGLRLTPTAIK